MTIKIQNVGQVSQSVNSVGVATPWNGLSVFLAGRVRNDNLACKVSKEEADKVNASVNISTQRS